MKINKQSNVYTIIYIVVLVVVVGCALAVTSMSLRDRQQANIKADTMGQILKSVHITPEADVAAQFGKLIVGQPLVSASGEIVSPDGASDVNVAMQIKKPADERQLRSMCANCQTVPKVYPSLLRLRFMGPDLGLCGL